MNAPLPKSLWKRWTARILHPSIQQDVSKKMAALRRVPFYSLLFWIHLARRNLIAGTLSATYRLIPLSTCSRQAQGKGLRHVSLFPDRRLIASAYTYWWCVVLTGVSLAMHAPHTSRILLHDIHLCLDRVVFLLASCAHLKGATSDLARRMFDPDGLYVMAVRGMSNELHALNTAHDARDG